MMEMKKHISAIYYSVLAVWLLCSPAVSLAQETMSDSAKMVLYAEEVYEGYLRQIQINNNDPVVRDLRDSINVLEEAGADSMVIVQLKEQVAAINQNIARKNYPIYKLAYTPWRYAIDNTPIKRIKHYTDGIDILHKLMADTTMTSATKRTYVEELMALYDDWLLHADALNKVVDNPFTKTYIRVRKANDYLDIYGDTLENDRENMRVLIQEILDEPGDNISNYDVGLMYRYYRYAEQAYREDMATHAKEYQEIYELALVKMNEYKAVVAQSDLPDANKENRQSTAQQMSEQVEERFTAFFRGSGNCEEDEATFTAQMEENFADEKFLTKVIVTMQYCDSSEIFVEALQNYLMYIDGNNVKFAKLLANKFYRQGRYDDCLAYYQIAEKGEEDVLEKSQIQYNMAVIYRSQKEIARASRYVKRAIDSNPDYGDAYVLLAQIYADKGVNWNTKPNINRLKFLVCIDKCEKARQCIRNAQGNPALQKFNRTTESSINGLVVSYKSNVPPTSEVFFEGGARYSTAGTTLVFDRGLLKGERTEIRFYD